MNSTTEAGITILLCDMDADGSEHYIKCIDALCRQTVLPHRLHYISNKSSRQHTRTVAMLKHRLPHIVSIEHNKIINPSYLLALAYGLQQCNTQYLLAINSNSILHDICIESIANYVINHDARCVALNVELTLDNDSPQWIESWLHRSVRFKHHQWYQRCTVGMLYTASERPLSTHRKAHVNRLLSDIMNNKKSVHMLQHTPVLSYSPSVTDMLPYHILRRAISDGYAVGVLAHQLFEHSPNQITPEHSDDKSTIIAAIEKIDTIIDCMHNDAANIQQGTLSHDVIDTAAIEQLCTYHYQLGNILARCYPLPNHINTIEKCTQYIPLTTPKRIARKIERDTIIPNRYRAPVGNIRIDTLVRYHLSRHRYIPLINWCLDTAKIILRMLRVFYGYR